MIHGKSIIKYLRSFKYNLSFNEVRERSCFRGGRDVEKNNSKILQARRFCTGETPFNLQINEKGGNTLIQIL